MRVFDSRGVADDVFRTVMFSILGTLERTPRITWALEVISSGKCGNRLADERRSAPSTEKHYYRHQNTISLSLRTPHAQQTPKMDIGRRLKNTLLSHTKDGRGALAGAGPATKRCVLTRVSNMNKNARCANSCQNCGTWKDRAHFHTL